MKRKYVIVLLLIAILAVFASFVIWRETSARTSVQARLTNHVNAVAHALWQLDADSINDYLALAVSSGGYRHLTIYAEDNVVFSQHHGPAASRLDEVMARLGLITDVTFRAPIFYAGEPVGWIEVVWRSNTIYSEVYFLLGLSLLGFLVERHHRVLEGRRVLETQVARRTRQLSDANAALRLSEERLRLAVDGGSVGIWKWNVVSDSLTWNDQLKLIFGLTEDTTGLNIQHFIRAIHPEDLSKVEVSLRAALAAQTTFHAEYRIIRPDGVVRWIAAQGHGHYDERGKPAAMAGVGLDITERKEAEQTNRNLLQESETSRRTLLSILEDQRRTEVELQKSEAIQRSIMESSSDTILLLDREATIRYINRGAPGVTLDGVIGSLVYDHVSTKFHSYMRACFSRVLQSGQPDRYQVDYQPPEGKQLTYESRVAPVWADGQVSGFAVIARDVTERRQTEEALRESERFRTRVFDTSPLIIYVYDLLEGRNVFVSRRIQEDLGYSPKQIVALGDRFFATMLHPEDAARLPQLLARWETARDEDLLTVEYRIQHADGNWHWFLGTDAVFQRGAGGRVLQIIGTALDITDRKLAETALRESELRHRLLAEITLSYSFAYSVSTDGSVTLEWVTEPMEDIIGYSEAEFRRGLSFRSLIHPEDQGLQRTALDRILTGRAEIIEYRLRTRSGQIRWLQSYHRPEWSETEQRVVRIFGATQDITDRKRAESERAVARQHVDLLTGLVQRLMDTPTARDAARLILQTADEILGWDACWLYLWHSQTGRFEDLVTIDSVDGERQEVPPNPESLSHPTPMSQRVMDEGAQLVLRESEDEATTPSKRFGSNRRSLSLMFAPIQRRGELIGIISIQSYRPKAYDADSLDLLRALGDHCASALYRIRTEESLRASEARLAAAQAHAHLGNWEVETATQKRIWSAEMFRLLDRDPALGPASLDEFLAAVHPQDVERFHQSRARAIAECVPHHEEFRIVGPKGRVRWVETHAESIVDAAGTLVRQVGTLQDITERKRAEEQIQHSGERLRRLSRRLIEIQETERRHLARELHDEIGQTLTAAKMHLQNLHLSPDSAPEHKRIADAIALVDGMLRTVRSLSLNLRPPMLDDLGLVPALRWLLDQHGRTSGQQVKFEHDDFDDRLDAVIETTCFRIAQEAITNVIRHAQAHEVHLQLRREPGTLVLSVRDDGRGFDVAEAFGRASRGSSMGLVSMEERASLTGGQIEFRSSDGNGTKLTARFPLTDRLTSLEPKPA